MNHVHLNGVAAQPWRNGGGVTRELLAWPDAARWLLRVSVAQVAQDGPFSAFAGVTRWFAVVDGAGVRLRLPGGEAALGMRDAPLCFDGGLAPGCRLTDGPTQDLNFMVQTHAGQGRMWRAAAGTGIGGRPHWRGLYAAQTVVLDVNGVRHAPAAGTLLWSGATDGAAQSWRLVAPGPAIQAWWLTWEAR